MASAGRIDPFTIGKFVVSIGGTAAGSFTEVSGLDIAIDPIDYREGNSGGPFAQKLPGLNHVSNVVLKRGLTQDLSLWAWINTVVTGNIQRKEVQITLHDQADNPVLMWKIKNAWPCKWTGPVLNANSGEVAIETLEIAHEGLDLGPAG